MESFKQGFQYCLAYASFPVPLKSLFYSFSSVTYLPKSHNTKFHSFDFDSHPSIWMTLECRQQSSSLNVLHQSPRSKGVNNSQLSRILRSCYPVRITTDDYFLSTFLASERTCLTASSANNTIPLQTHNINMLFLASRLTLAYFP